MLNPLVMQAFSRELEKRALINPVRVNQARQGMLPGRPLLTRFAKTSLGKQYVRHAPTAGGISHNMLLSAQRGEPTFALNAGIGGVAREGLVPVVGKTRADLATLLKRQDMGYAGTVAEALAAKARALSPNFGSYVGDAVETATGLIA